MEAHEHVGDTSSGSVVGSCIIARCLIDGPRGAWGAIFFFQFFRNGDVRTLECWVHRVAVAQWAVCAVCLLDKWAKASNRLDCDYPTLRYLALSLLLPRLLTGHASVRRLPGKVPASVRVIRQGDSGGTRVPLMQGRKVR